MTQVGDVLYEFDANRRIYRQDKSGGPIYSGHFSPHMITGETPKSWLIERAGTVTKVNKQTMLSSNSRYGATRWHTAEGKADCIWVHENRARITSTVSVLTDVGQLKQIAEIVGVKT